MITKRNPFVGLAIAIASVFRGPPKEPQGRVIFVDDEPPKRYKPLEPHQYIPPHNPAHERHARMEPKVMVIDPETKKVTAIPLADAERIQAAQERRDRKSIARQEQRDRELARRVAAKVSQEVRLGT